MKTIETAEQAEDPDPIKQESLPEISSVKRLPRIDSVDLLRGLVMIIMALDHSRSPYFTNFPVSPEDTQHTYLALFLTRWITHFCAPLFFLLAGTGAYLSIINGKTVKEISGFFWKRGLWLIFLELTVIDFAWAFNPSWRFGGVIWTLGWVMLVMALIVRLPFKAIAGFGIALICLHNLADPIKPAPLGSFSWVWTFLHSIGTIKIESIGYNFFILFALIPWVGVMASGYALGKVYTWPAQRRRRWLLITGALMTLAFIILRAANLYGNPAPFQIQDTTAKTIISFLNTAKYPASLQFLLMTLGPSFMLLAWFDRFDYSSAFGRLGQKILVYGRVPLFFYILHIFTLHVLAIIVGLICGQPISWLWGGQLPINPQAPPEYGHSLPFAYLMMLLTVVLLYFPCKWFAGLKRKRKDWWLRYL